MRKHPEVAHGLLRSVPGLEGAAELLYTHQERPDGKGYPRGISRDIKKGALVLAAVDAFDAMVNERPYPRPRMSFNDAYAELQDGAGAQFSPDVVEALIRLHREGRLDEELQRVIKGLPTPDPVGGAQDTGDGRSRSGEKAGEPSRADTSRRDAKRKGRQSKGQERPEA